MRFKTLLSIGVIFLCSSVLALAALDLSFTTAISQSPDPANVGATVYFTVNSKTFGGAVDNLKVIGGVDGANIYTLRYSHIDADKQRTDSFDWIAVAGAHTVWFELDPDHTAGDSDYTNNRVEKALTIGCPSGLPNLKPNVSYRPSSFKAGDDVNFEIDVINNGNGASVPTSIFIKEGNYLGTTRPIRAIYADQKVEVFYVVRNIVCGVVITIKVDADSVNAESDETDNTWSKTMMCGGPVMLGELRRKTKFYAEYPSIHLPAQCITCPPWHKVAKPGDPLRLLDGIGTKLAGGAKFEDVKGDWLLFLKNSNGLDPNTALRLIFNKATEGGAGRFGSELDARNFQNSLNKIINQLVEASNEFFK